LEKAFGNKKTTVQQKASQNTEELYLMILMKTKNLYIATLKERLITARKPRLNRMVFEKHREAERERQREKDREREAQREMQRLRERQRETDKEAEEGRETPTPKNVGVNGNPGRGDFKS